MRRVRPIVAVTTSLLVVGCASTSSADRTNSSTSPTRSPSVVATATSATGIQGDVATSGHRRLINRVRGIHHAHQVVLVTAKHYGTSYAHLRGFRKTSNGWRRTWGPWPARIGRNGFAPRGDKREGDGRTPTGSYHFTFMFGIYSDPGVRYHYRRALHTSWWDDDPSSANYNRWVDSRYGDPGRNPESMYQPPSYNYGAVIGYNLSRTPGKGSAIFLHVSHDSATAGCVSIPQTRLLKVLRWLRPARHPRIIMGTLAAVTD